MANIDDLIRRLNLAKNCLDEAFKINDKRARLDSLATEASETGSWKVSVDYGTLHAEIERYNTIISGVNDILSLMAAEDDAAERVHFADDISNLLSDMQSLILEQKLVEKYDTHDAIISIKAGTGRVHAEQFMRDLYKAYCLFAKKQGFDLEPLNENGNHITFLVRGTNAYGWFRGEHGVHRFEYRAMDEKRQTSLVNVKLIPDIEEEDIVINQNDLLYEPLGASTKGGQNANRNRCGVRITHKPTQITATVITSSYKQSKKLAEQVLYARVAAHLRDEAASERESETPAQVRTEYGRHFRSYMLDGENRIRDHVSKAETRDIDGFFKGDIDHFILSYHGVTFSTTERDSK